MTTVAEKIAKFNSDEAESISEGAIDLAAIWGRLRNAQHIAQDDPQHVGKNEAHADLVPWRLAACLYTAGREVRQEQHVAGTYTDGSYGLTLMNRAAVASALYFGTDVDILREQEIAPVFVEHLDSTETVRNAAFDALKATWEPGTITQLNGRSMVMIGGDPGRNLLATQTVSITLPPQADDELEIVFTNMLQSEADGYFIEFDVPDDAVIASKTVSFNFVNEAVYRYERPSAEGPNVYDFAFLRISNGDRFTNASVTSYSTRTFASSELARLEVVGSREFYGIRTTITRTETAVVDEDDA